MIVDGFPSYISFVYIHMCVCVVFDFGFGSTHAIIRSVMLLFELLIVFASVLLTFFNSILVPV